MTSITLFLAVLAAAPEDQAPLYVTADLTLPKDAVLRRPLVIRAGHIAIDGNGAVIQGADTPGDPRTFAGTGITAEGVSGVTIRNLKVRGFERGLAARDGEAWLLEGCDFSDNYHDPEFGWGESKPAGGMILTRITRSVIRNCAANRVWNALSLADCHENLVEGCDLSHASNVCLKLWTACRNRIIGNNLSWGLRIKPGEVHARDSTSVLMESGSNDNFFYRNDITHGGDGIFIRVLNGWVSTGNVFVENDCSWANNNCVESWSPGNTYIRNRANHGSYGFWLGGSDQTRLIGNEAAYNGLPDGFHNAPEPGFGHGGIVIVGGSSSHTLIEGNHCHHNAGGGIVFRGDAASKGAAWRTHHWIVQNNVVEHNRFGIWGAYGDWIFLGANVFRNNAEGNRLEDVTNLIEAGGDPAVLQAPRLVLDGPSRAFAGQPVVFDAARSFDPSGKALAFRWQLGDAPASGPRVEHVFTRIGFHRVGVTVSNGPLADLGFRDFIVTAPVAEEIGTEGRAGDWGFEMQGNEDGKGLVTFADDPDAVAGRVSLCWTPDPYKGMYAAAIYPKSRDAGWNLAGKPKVVFWLQAVNNNIPGFQEPGPVITLHGKDGAIKIQPSGGRNLLVGTPYSEARWTWMPVAAPLTADKDWVVATTGSVSLAKIDAVSIAFDSWGGDPFTIWLDGLAFQ